MVDLVDLHLKQINAYKLFSRVSVEYRGVGIVLFRYSKI